MITGIGNGILHAGEEPFQPTCCFSFLHFFSGFLHGNLLRCLDGSVDGSVNRGSIGLIDDIRNPNTGRNHQGNRKSKNDQLPGNTPQLMPPCKGINREKKAGRRNENYESGIACYCGQILFQIDRTDHNKKI